MALDHGLITPEDRHIDIMMRAGYPTQEEVERPTAGDPIRGLATSHG